jgi:hypothetical protein
MRSDMIEKIRQNLSREYVMRSLVKYFVERGFKSNFDIHVYPPTLQDIPKQIPALAEKIEVIPYVENIDPKVGIVKLGWNMFALGTKRMFLGKTMHKNLMELKQTTAPAGSILELNATPRKVIRFLLSVFEDENETVNVSTSVIPMVPMQRPRTGSSGGSYYEKRRPVL